MSHYLVFVFVREKKNQSGMVSLQIIAMSSGCYRVAKTAESLSDPEDILPESTTDPGIRDDNIKTF